MAGNKNSLVDKAYELYKQGIPLVEIANQLGKPAGTIRRWKSTYGWDSERSDKKSERSGKKRANKEKVIDDGTKETLQNEELTPEQQMFCIYYSRTFNATQSYLKAYGCSYEVANAKGPCLVVKDSIKAEINRLKEIKRQQIVASEDDIVELYMRIAFADIRDYLSFGPEEQEVIGSFGPVMVKDEDGNKVPLKRVVNTVKLKESDNVDTQLIQEITEGKNGVSVKLADRNKALEWLTKFFNMNPMDKHKQEFDRQKMELELLRLEMQVKNDEVPEDAAEDNFLEALNATAKNVWSDE